MRRWIAAFLLLLCATTAHAAEPARLAPRVEAAIHDALFVDPVPIADLLGTTDGSLNLNVIATPAVGTTSRARPIGSLLGHSDASHNLYVTLAAGSVFPGGGLVFPGQTIGDTIYADSTTTFTRLADVAAGSYFRSGGVGVAPAWSTLTLPNTAVAGSLAVATATNVLGAVADVATGQVLVSGGVGVVPAFSATPSVTSLSATSGLTLTTTAKLSSTTLGSFGPIADGVYTYLKNDGSTGASIRVQASGSLDVRDATNSSGGTWGANAYNVGGALTLSSTTPSLSSGFGTSSGIVSGRTAAFRWGVGTGGVATTGVITVASASVGWNCNVTDITNPALFVTVQTASTTTTASFANFSRTTGLAVAWTASDVLAITCTGF